MSTGGLVHITGAKVHGEKRFHVIYMLQLVWTDSENDAALSRTEFDDPDKGTCRYKFDLVPDS